MLRFPPGDLAFKNGFIFRVLPRPVSDGGGDLSVLVFFHFCSKSFVSRAALQSFAGSAVLDGTVREIPPGRRERRVARTVRMARMAAGARQIQLCPSGRDRQPHAAQSLAQLLPDFLIE